MRIECGKLGITKNLYKMHYNYILTMYEYVDAHTAISVNICLLFVLFATTTHYKHHCRVMRVMIEGRKVGDE